MRIPRVRTESGSTRRRQVALFVPCSLLLAGGALWGAEPTSSSASLPFQQLCFGCHSKTAAMGGINLQQLTSQPAFGDNFQHWQKVATALEEKRMPPAKMKQPTDEQRSQTVQWIRARLDDYARKHAGDPGKVAVRRLTSGEYAYAIRDLTGIDIKVDSDFVADSVGGEGFTNFGDVQFMDNANLERYLETAKRVAAHAVVGSGPLQFYIDPGKSGMELSAVSRIQQIYTSFGFRAVAAEGGRPYGLDRYGKAFYAAWRHQHRAALGEPKLTLADQAARVQVPVRFVEHIWSVVNQASPRYPTSEVVSRFRKLPVPKSSDEKATAAAMAGATEIQQFVINWPRWLFAAGALAAGGQGDERALLITDSAIQVKLKDQFRYFTRGRKQPITKVHFSVTSANAVAKDKPTVLWRNAYVRFVKADRKPGPQQPLSSVLDEATRQRLNFGKRPDGSTGEPNEFITVGDTTFNLEIPTPADAAAVSMTMEAELLPGAAGDAVVRCVISESEDTSKGRPAWALLGDPKSEGYKSWKNDVLDFAANLPQNSHGEPTPADRDAIPLPFDNAYNQPERDLFHVKLKYYRTDNFLVEKMLDDASRKRLNEAWNDLLASFEYHDIFMRFVANKYKVDLKGKGIAQLLPTDIEAMPEEPRKYIKALRAEYDSVMRAQQAARPGHVEDSLRFASNAWRRPLTDAEKASLRAFYTKLRTGPELDHTKAIRSLISRVLISPAFLYRLEQPTARTAVARLNDWDMASRLSFFLWSSIPDAELRRAAAAGELSNPAQIEHQVKRMLADPKARRFATEFFGQWLGFYRFDQHRGVDTSRFPEFTDDVREAMYEEAIAFFEHIVRKDRPVKDMFAANYTFLNEALAKHYGVKRKVESKEALEMVEGANEFQRGGMLRLGAVLTATSAPLRTSPVKRGDWMLRRILGTPTPPPPPDAGSIPADEKAFGGQTLRERLESHKRNATCAGCHTRIDPLGFPFERYDSIGRWRDKYSDGKPVEDSTAMADNKQISGVDGLLAYLQTQDKQVMRTLAAKLVGYALGRTALISDQPLIEEITADGFDTPFSRLVSGIAASKQFRYRRERDDTAPAGTPAQRTTKALPNRKSDKVGGL